MTDRLILPPPGDIESLPLPSRPSSVATIGDVLTAYDTGGLRAALLVITGQDEGVRDADILGAVLLRFEREALS